MAEEDLIFGKNRHMFGGISPSNMKKFAATQMIGKTVPTIIAELPDNTVINGQTLCTVAGAIIRRKTTGYPVDEFDGDAVMTITSSGNYIDNNAPKGELYYAAFPYTTQGVYNRSHKNRAFYRHTDARYIFGYDLDLKDPNPSTRVTYPSDTSNSNYTNAYMNFTTGAFNYGDWPSEAGSMFMPKPCLLSSAGQVICYLNQNDYTKQVSGAAAPSSGNAMMEWPKIYTKRYVENGVYKFRCSDTKLNDDWDCWCNYDINNNEIDHFYTAIYPGRNNNGTIVSRTGLAPSADFLPILDAGMSTFDRVRKRATDIGNGWDLDLLSDRLLINDLLVMMAKTTDLRTAYGWGASMDISSGNYLINGTMNSKGLFWGSQIIDKTTSTNVAQGVKVFGMEHWWGNIYRAIAGFLVDTGVIKVKYTSGTHDGSTATGYNSSGDGYLTLADLSDYTDYVGSYIGFISSAINTPAGRIPIGKNGSLSTYECDQFNYFHSTSANDIKFAEVSFSGTSASNYGPFHIKATVSVNGKDSYCGASLSYKPVKE